MAELRAPDPTLTAYAAEREVGTDIAVLNPYDDGVAAHLIVSADKTACGLTWDYTHPVHLARWFAVPCSRCFPSAPPPGSEWRSYETHGDGLVSKPGAHPDLAWQVRS